MIAGLMKICKAAEYLGVSPKRARLILANMNVLPITENPPIWRKADIDKALGYDVKGEVIMPTPEPPKIVKLQVCKAVWVPQDKHAAIKAFAEGLGMEVRDLCAQLLCEMIEKKTNGEHKSTQAEAH